jgi:hypothetical protein
MDTDICPTCAARERRAKDLTRLDEILRAMAWENSLPLCEALAKEGQEIVARLRAE